MRKSDRGAIIHSPADWKFGHLDEEDREEDDTLNQSGENDGDLKNVGTSTWVATSSFGCFHSDESHTDTGANGCETYVDFAFDGCEEEHEEFSHFLVLVWFRDPGIHTFLRMVLPENSLA